MKTNILKISREELNKLNFPNKINIFLDEFFEKRKEFPLAFIAAEFWKNGFSSLTSHLIAENLTWAKELFYRGLINKSVLEDALYISIVKKKEAIAYFLLTKGVRILEKRFDLEEIKKLHKKNILCDYFEIFWEEENNLVYSSFPNQQKQFTKIML